MKLSFSTLGCPDFDWSDICSTAKDFGFAGIELRGLGADIFSVNAKPFRAENIDATIEQLKKLRLEICCISSGCALKYPERRAEAISELTQYIEKEYYELNLLFDLYTNHLFEKCSYKLSW